MLHILPQSQLEDGDKKEIAEQLINADADVNALDHSLRSVCNTLHTWSSVSGDTF